MTRPLELTALAVVCDMDGTLVDSTAVVEAVWAEFADRYGVDVDEVLRYAHGRQCSDTVAHFLPAGHDPVAATAHVDAQELDHLEGIVEVPGAAAFLDSLRGRPVAVVTSASRALARRRMRAAGVPVPDVLVAAEDVTSGKPSPEGYLRAASLLGVDPAECVIFEDAEAGVRAAGASGGSVVVVGGHVSATTQGLPRLADFTDLSVSTRDGRIRLRHP